MYPRWLPAGCIVLLAQADGEPGVMDGVDLAA